MVFLKKACFAGVCVSGAGHGENVRLQEAGEEEDQEAQRRVHGAEREADPGESQQPICGEPPDGTCTLGAIAALHLNQFNSAKPYSAAEPRAGARVIKTSSIMSAKNYSPVFVLIPHFGKEQQWGETPVMLG